MSENEDTVTINFITESESFDVDIPVTHYEMLVADAEKQGLTFEELILQVLRNAFQLDDDAEELAEQ